MSQHKPTSDRIRTSTLAGLAMIAFFLYILYNMFKGFYIYIILGAVFAISLRPLHRRISKLIGGKSRVAALITMLLTALLIFIPLFFLLQMIASQAIAIGKNTSLPGIERTLDELIMRINEFAGRFTNGSDVVSRDQVLRYLQDAATAAGQNLLRVLTNIPSLIAGGVIMLMSLFYTLADWDKLRAYIYKYSPLSDKATRRLVARALAVIRAAIKGNIIMIGVYGTIGGIGLWIAGIKPVLLLGVIYGIASLVPIIGNGIVWIPSVIYLVITGNYPMAIFLAIWNMLVTTNMDNIVVPMLVKKGASLHPFLILVGVLGGVSLFGVVGFIVGPTIIAMTLVSIELLKKNEIEEESP